LDQITAGTLRIGSATATGGITVSADVSPANAPILRLQGDGGVVTGTDGGIAVTSLGIVAGGAVNFTDSSTNVTNLAIDTSTGDVTFVEADGFSVTTVDTAVVGVDTDSGAVALTATDGNLVVVDTANADDIAATGTIALSAGADDTLTISASADVESTGGAHTYTGDGIDVSGTVTATGQTVLLKSTTAGDAIDLGGADAADTLGITDTEMDAITADTLRIGASDAGNIVVSAAITQSKNLSLLTGGTITQGGGFTLASTGLQLSAG